MIYLMEQSDALSVLNSLRGQADRVAGIKPPEPQPAQRFAPGEGIAAGLNELLAGLNEKDKTPRDFTKVGKFFSDKLSNVKAFGVILGTGGAILGSKIIDYAWHHKGEIAAGMAGGALAKTAMRLLLAGSGGIAPAMAIGAVGGAAGGALKEYVKQRSGLSIVEAGDKLVIDGLRNEFRRLGASDKGKIGKAALRGAAFGVAGAVLSDVVAENDWVQQQLSKIHLPSGVYPSPAAQPTPEPTHPAVPGVEAVTPAVPPAETLTIPKGSSIWTETKTYLEQNLDHPPTSTEINDAVHKIMTDNNITDARSVPAGASLNIHGVNEMIGKVAPSQLDISPELAKMPEVIQLPAGSNPWDEVSRYGSSYLGRPLSDMEKLTITRELAKQSGIAVPGWDLKVGIEHTKLPVGFRLLFNDSVKKLLEGMKK